MDIYNLPIYAIKETLGKPELFTGRRRELNFLLKWAGDIEWNGILTGIMQTIINILLQ